jgi:DNA polymerase V
MFKIETETSGFSSPAETYVSERLNPSDLLMQNPMSTFFLSASGNFMDVSDGDILVVDRSREPGFGDKVVLAKSGRLELELYSGQKEVWGVLMFSIKKHTP